MSALTQHPPLACLPACLQCMLCDRGWHARCRPPGARLVAKKFLVCPRHSQQEEQEEQQAAAGARAEAAPSGLPPQQRQLAVRAVPAQEATQRDEHQPAGMPEQRGQQGLGPSVQALQNAQQLQQLKGGEESEDGELPPAPSENVQPLEQLEARAAVEGARSEAAPAAAVVAAEGQQVLQQPEVLPGHSGGSSQTLEPAACGEAQQAYQVPQQQYPQQQTAPQAGFSSPFNMAQQQPAMAGGSGAGPPQDLDALQEGPLQQEAEQQPLARGMSLQPSWQASLASRALLDYGEL